MLLLCYCVIDLVGYLEQEYTFILGNAHGQLRVVQLHHFREALQHVFLTFWLD